MSELEIIGLFAVALAAGAINAVAGGGTTLTFPALLFFGIAPRVAIATSTFALLIGIVGSLVGFRQHLPTVKPWLWRFVPASILGALLGSWLLTHTGEKSLSKLVPFLILFAAVLILIQGISKRFAGFEAQGGPPGKQHAIWGAILFQFAIAMYGGYFGAGIGILMLAHLGFTGLRDIHQINTLKTVLAFVINLAASGWFIGAGLIDWPRAAVMTVGAVAGYFLGSHYSQRIPQRRVRQLIAILGFAIAAVTFYKEFLG